MSLPRPARPVCPFVTAGTIEDPGLFVGRKDELRRLAGWMSGSQPVSVNVVGGRLSGKSSLLQHFTQTYAQRVTEPHRFLVVCICLRLAKPKTEAEFYQTLAAALSKLRAVAQCKPLRAALAACSGGGTKEFTDLLELLSGRHLLPVFCVDEFEKLFDHKETLGKDFYAAWAKQQFVRERKRSREKSGCRATRQPQVPDEPWPRMRRSARKFCWRLSRPNRWCAPHHILNRQDKHSAT